MSNERVLDPGVWASGTPGFISGADTPESLGYWFELDAPGWLTGFSVYTDGGHPEFVLYQVWTAAPLLIATTIRTAAETYRAAPAGWRRTWLHPRCPLAAATPYLLSCSLTRFSADFGRLTSAPVVSGHITVYQDGSSPHPRNGIYDATADSGGRFLLTTPPTDGVNGHLYGLDMLIEFPL